MNDKPSEKNLQLISRWITNIENAINEFYSALDTSVPKEIRKPIFSIQGHTKKIRRLLVAEASELELLIEIRVILDRSKVIAEIISVNNEETSTATQTSLSNLHSIIITGDDLLKKMSDNTSQIYQTQEASHRINVLEIRVREAVAQVKKSEQLALRTEKRLADIAIQTQKIIEDVKDKSIKTNEELQEKIKSADLSIKQLKEKEVEVNNLVGIISGTSIAGSYSVSASAELMWANATRNGSVFLMLAIALIVGYSLLETTSPHFDSQIAIFRLVFSVALSIPAAYLSRESAKHRAKQHEYLRTSLDLQSIAPYLASLPDDEQHKLKSEMASRIFAAPNSQQNNSDSYPLDLHALLMKLVDKIPTSSESKGSIGQEDGKGGNSK